jgi:hypothetical protein
MSAIARNFIDTGVNEVDLSPYDTKPETYKDHVDC